MDPVSLKRVQMKKIDGKLALNWLAKRTIRLCFQFAQCYFRPVPFSQTLLGRHLKLIITERNKQFIIKVARVREAVAKWQRHLSWRRKFVWGDMHIIDISLRFARAIFSDRIYRGKILPQINRHIIIIRTIGRKKKLNLLRRDLS